MFLIAVGYPLLADGYTVGNIVYFFTWIFMALGLSLIWGYGGALSFGQTAFFGIAGYAYGVLTINFGAAYGLTLVAVIVALVCAAVFAAVLGYFLFFGRISGVFLGIVTLSVTLIFERFMAQTAGPEWHIGKARLNGFNGMSGMPPITMPWPGGDLVLFPDVGLYYLMLGLLVLVYLGLRILVNSRFGNVLVAIRENPERAEMLGYDIRKYQLGAFVIGAALAGLSGVLYTSWGQYITPSSMSITAAALPIVWVAVGGRGDLTATLVGTLVVLSAFQALTIYGSQYALVVMGLLLVVTVLAAPSGLIVGAANLIFRNRRGPKEICLMAILETRNLNKHFGGLHVTADVNFALEPGELHCLIGPNGAGKSTLFRLILGEHEPSSGAILYEGEDITALKPFARIRRGMSVKFQVPGIFKALSTRQNLETALQHHLERGSLADEIDRLLAFLNLDRCQFTHAGNLSHGQKQWLEIGMAISLKPQLLLLDEPTAGMSPTKPTPPAKWSRRLNADGMTVLAVEHDMGFVRQVAQQVTVLHFGRIFAQGSIDEIVADERVAEIYLGHGHA